MFSSKSFVNDVFSIPAHWIFETYLGLTEPLTGQRVRIHSIFNPADKNPSMFIYYNTDFQCYKYKCFSTGKSGSAIDLMMNIWKLSFAETAKRIEADYAAYLKTGKRCDTKIIEHSPWKVTDYKIRSWTQSDADFWSPFNISSTILDTYCVRPLENYTMTKLLTDGIQTEEFTITGKNIYGYFNKEGVLYKIYQPLNRERKFIKICDYLQGHDQLVGHKHLVITSSLKDIMSVKSMPFIQLDLIAPDSENTIIDKKMIDHLKTKYNCIATMMDSDAAGIKSMKKYEDTYNIPSIYLPQEKDISDIVKVHGVQKALYYMAPVLHRALDKYKILNMHVA